MNHNGVVEKKENGSIFMSKISHIINKYKYEDHECYKYEYHEGLGGVFVFLEIPIIITFKLL